MMRGIYGIALCFRAFDSSCCLQVEDPRINELRVKASLDIVALVAVALLIKALYIIPRVLLALVGIALAAITRVVAMRIMINMVAAVTLFGTQLGR